MTGSTTAVLSIVTSPVPPTSLPPIWTRLKEWPVHTLYMSIFIPIVEINIGQLDIDQLALPDAGISSVLMIIIILTKTFVNFLKTVFKQNTSQNVPSVTCFFYNQNIEVLETALLAWDIWISIQHEEGLKCDKTRHRR